MPRWVALLRAVNLGARNKVPMKALAALVEDLGHGDVHTYLQSGNVAFDAGATDEERLARQLEKAVADAFGVDTAVVLRKGPELDRVVARNPFAKEAEADPTKVAVHFLRDRLRKADVPDTPDGVAEEVVADGRHLYVSYPNGQGRTALDQRYWRRYPSGMVATARNWKTVLALRDL